MLMDTVGPSLFMCVSQPQAPSLKILEMANKWKRQKVEGNDE